MNDDEILWLVADKTTMKHFIIAKKIIKYGTIPKDILNTNRKELRTWQRINKILRANGLTRNAHKHK